MEGGFLQAAKGSNKRISRPWICWTVMLDAKGSFTVLTYCPKLTKGELVNTGLYLLGYKYPKSMSSFLRVNTEPY